MCYFGYIDFILDFRSVSGREMCIFTIELAQLTWLRFLVNSCQWRPQFIGGILLTVGIIIFIVVTTRLVCRNHRVDLGYLFNPVSWMHCHFGCVFVVGNFGIIYSCNSSFWSLFALFIKECLYVVFSRAWLLRQAFVYNRVSLSTSGLIDYIRENL